MCIRDRLPPVRRLRSSRTRSVPRRLRCLPQWCRCRTCRAHVAAQTGTRRSVKGGTAVCTSRSSVCPTKSTSRRPANRRGSSRCGKWPRLGEDLQLIIGEQPSRHRTPPRQTRTTGTNAAATITLTARDAASTQVSHIRWSFGPYYRDPWRVAGAPRAGLFPMGKGRRSLVAAAWRPCSAREARHGQRVHPHLYSHRRRARPAPLATLVARAPDLVRRMLAAAAQEAASETDPRLPERRRTAIIATYCEHLAAMEMTVYSVARRRLPGGEQAAVVEALAHDAELVMREMEERIGGDRFAAAGPFAQLQDRFEVAFAAHVEAERALAGRLQGRLAPAEHDALVTRLDSALRHAPTRPHPYGPHTSRLTPLAFRLRALADHTLDVMDNRRGADHPPPERPVEGGRPS